MHAGAATTNISNTVNTNLVYILNKYLWRTYYALDTVSGLKEVTFSGGEGQIQNTLGVCSVAMIEVT